MRYIAFALSIFFSISLFAQIEEPVEWSFKTKHIGNDEFDLISTATVDKGWYIYSQDLADDGPVPTTFSFDAKESRYELVGRTDEDGNFIEGFDKIFEMHVKKFKNKAVFTQRVKLKKKRASIKGSLEFMTCNDEKCLPPEIVDFKFTPSTDDPIGKSNISDNDNRITTPVNVTISNNTSNAIDDSEDINATNDNDIVDPFDGMGQGSGILDPVKWKMKSVKVAEGVYDLKWNAEIEDGWYVYSRDIEEGGPVPTAFTFKTNKSIAFEIEKLKEYGSKMKEGNDPIFDMYLKKYAENLEYSTQVKVTGKDTKLVGSLEYMTCDASRCLPPELIDFEFNLKGEGEEIDLGFIGEAPVGGLGGKYKIASIDLANPVNDCGEKDEGKTSEKGILTIFFLGFLGGLVALLTPCVFPMIPLTVSFFTKSNKSKTKGIINALTYGFFIFLIYIILSIPFHFLDSINPEILNDISTNVYLNIAFFIIFVVFAISFFGYFEITLPSGIANKADSASNLGGLIGIFFMALTLALVSFSCTGPILGSLLAGAMSSDGGAMQLSAGMGGFGLALGIPFAIFALFPNMLNSLPKSGGWLNTVKVVLGFLELALAIKFLSNADLVKNWGILPREVFFALWILIGIGLCLYLFGLIRFPHDSKEQKIGIPRIVMGVATLAFVVYLLPGLSKNNKYANRSLLSGFPPPLFYSIYNKKSKCPLDLECFKDYAQGLAKAKELNKPILLDFTGWACVNCRKMEENVWVEPEIFRKLNEEFVLISLYVDDKRDLPIDKQETITTSYGKKKKIGRKGDMWATMQTETFENNSQPYYAIMSPNEILLNRPVGYKPNANEYSAFLECGLNAMDQLENEEQSSL